MIEVWLAVIAAGIGTYAIRLAFIAMHQRIAMPRWFTSALTFVPVAVLSAIIVPELLAGGNTPELSFDIARLLAGVIAIFTAWRTKSIWLTIAAGFVTLFAFRAILT